MATLTPASSSPAPTNQSTTNMYRVGDYVYFENSASNSYAIRRIEELNKTPNGNVEARVMCFYRRSELPQNLIAQADRHHFGDEIDPDSDEEDTPGVSKEKAERQEMKLREVFLSRQVETLPATLIRGKCSVTLLSEVETAKSYTSREDAFFYALVFDPHQKTLVADRGEIRIGSGYQATVPPLLGKEEADPRDTEEGLADMIWDPQNKLNDSDVDKFLIVSRSVGTFARALDCSSSVKQPSLHMSAAAASRDITLFQAHDLLHKHKYDYASAVKSLVPTTGPMLCRDEMEDWSASEANLFEEAIEKYGKGFNDIKKDFLPWKSMKNIIEYFFMWKTTDRYVQQKRIKAMEAESKLKQVYVPPYTNKTSRLTGSNGEVIIRGRDCDAYPKLEKYSWVQYKKYGKFLPATMIDDCFILDKSLAGNAMAARLTQLRPGLIIEPGSPAAKPGQSGKTRTAFYLRTTPITRAARRVLPNMRLRYYARRTGKAIDMKAAKEDVKKLMVGMSEAQIRKYNSFSKKDRVKMSVVVKRLGQEDDSEHQWLILTPKDQIPKPEKEFFPRPSKRPDGSYIYERIPGHNDKQAQHQQILYKKRVYDEGKTAPEPVVPTKFQRSDHYGRGGSIPVRIPRDHEAGPKGRIATLTRVAGGHKQIISWMDAPDDVFFKANPATKKLRRKLSVTALRKAARKPFKKVLSVPGVTPAVTPTSAPPATGPSPGLGAGATTVTPVLL